MTEERVLDGARRPFFFFFSKEPRDPAFRSIADTGGGGQGESYKEEAEPGANVNSHLKLRVDGRRAGNRAKKKKKEIDSVRDHKISDDRKPKRQGQ